MTTKIESFNKTYETIGLGEVNLLKGIGLRNIYMKILLPDDLTLPFVQLPYANNCIVDKPVKYISKFREFKADKKPLRLMISRILPNNEEIFSGNLLVSIEDYIVYENAGENGDFWVELNLKEYVEIQAKELTPISSQDSTYSLTSTRTSKEPAKTYTVKSGDNLWNIAKVELNDATRWQEIATLNNISNYKNLQVGQVLQLP